MDTIKLDGTNYEMFIVYSERSSTIMFTVTGQVERYWGANKDIADVFANASQDILKMSVGEEEATTDTGSCVDCKFNEVLFDEMPCKKCLPYSFLPHFRRR